MRTRLVLLILLAALALVAAGCGHKQKPKTAADWANGFCGSVATWKSSLTSAKNEFASNPSQDTLKSAGNDIKNSTDKLVSDVKALGKPPTEDGAKAQQEAQALSSQVHQTQQTIQTAVQSITSASNALNAASIITTNLKHLQAEAQTTFDQLKQLDPGSELATAFKQSSTCTSVGF